MNGHIKIGRVMLHIGEVLRIKRNEGRKSNKYLRFSISSFFGEKGIVIQKVILDMH